MTNIPPDSSEIIDLKYGHKVKVERTRPENSPKWLSMQLVEAFEEERVHRMEKESYKTNACSEGQKVQQLKAVIHELKERKKNPPKKISRMDPYNTYNLDLCKEELTQAMDRMQEFTQTAAKHAEGERTAQITQRDLQKRLKDVNART
jgi:hypothetical protein